MSLSGSFRIYDLNDVKAGKNNAEADLKELVQEVKNNLMLDVDPRPTSDVEQATKNLNNEVLAQQFLDSMAGTAEWPTPSIRCLRSEYEADLRQMLDLVSKWVQIQNELNAQTQQVSFDRDLPDDGTVSEALYSRPEVLAARRLVPQAHEFFVVRKEFLPDSVDRRSSFWLFSFFSSNSDGGEREKLLTRNVKVGDEQMNLAEIIGGFVRRS